MQEMFNKPATLCWRCAKATCGCSWSLFFIPVKGWKAVRTNINNELNGGNPRNRESYHIYECPEYVSDDERGVCIG